MVVRALKVSGTEKVSVPAGTPLSVPLTVSDRFANTPTSATLKPSSWKVPPPDLVRVMVVPEAPVVVASPPKGVMKVSQAPALVVSTYPAWVSVVSELVKT